MCKKCIIITTCMGRDGMAKKPWAMLKDYYYTCKPFIISYLMCHQRLVPK